MVTVASDGYVKNEKQKVKHIDGADFAYVVGSGSGNLVDEDSILH